MLTSVISGRLTKPDFSELLDKTDFPNLRVKTELADFDAVLVVLKTWRVSD